MTNDNTSKRKVPNFSSQQPRKKAISLHFKYNKATSTKCIVSNISTTYTVGTSPFLAVNEAARTASKKVSPRIDRQQKKNQSKSTRKPPKIEKKRNLFVRSSWAWWDSRTAEASRRAMVFSSKPPRLGLRFEGVTAAIWSPLADPPSPATVVVAPPPVPAKPRVWSLSDHDYVKFLRFISHAFATL